MSDNILIAIYFGTTGYQKQKFITSKDLSDVPNDGLYHATVFNVDGDFVGFHYVSDVDEVTQGEYQLDDNSNIVMLDLHINDTQKHDTDDIPGDVPHRIMEKAFEYIINNASDIAEEYIDMYPLINMQLAHISNSTYEWIRYVNNANNIYKNINGNWGSIIGNFEKYDLYKESSSLYDEFTSTLIGDENDIRFYLFESKLSDVDGVAISISSYQPAIMIVVYFTLDHMINFANGCESDDVFKTDKYIFANQPTTTKYKINKVTMNYVKNMDKFV